MKNKFILLSLLIILIGVLPRMIEVLSGNYLFGFDQGLFYQDVKRIVVDHRLTLIGSFTGGQGGLFQGPGWYYLLSVPFFLWHGDPIGGMYLMLLMGLSTIILSIYFGSKIFGKTTGLIIGLLIASSSAVISQSRFIWPPFPISLLSVFFLYFLYKVLQQKERFLLLLSFTIGLMSHFELATAGPMFLQFIILSAFILTKKIVSLKYFILSLCSFLISVFPLILFNFRHGGILLKGVLNASPSANPNHQVTLRYIQAILSNHYEVFRLNFLSSFNNANYIWPILLGFFVLGTVIYIRDRKIKYPLKLFLLYLITSPIMLFICFALYLWPMWQWWILQLIIFYNFAFGILTVYFWNKKPGLRIFLILCYFLFSTIFIKETVGFYQKDLYDYGGTAKIRGKEDAIDFIYRDSQGKKFNLLVFSPPVYTFPYEYLLWWYGQKKYGFIPGNEKKGVFYLLIEPDPYKPWSYKGWLETVVKTGRVIKTVELPSGFIVQKREE